MVKNRFVRMNAASEKFSVAVQFRAAREGVPSSIRPEREEWYGSGATRNPVDVDVIIAGTPDAGASGEWTLKSEHARVYVFERP